MRRSFVNSDIPCATTQSRSISVYTLLHGLFLPHIIAIYDSPMFYIVWKEHLLIINTLSGGTGLYLKQLHSYA